MFCSFRITKNFSSKFMFWYRKNTDFFNPYWKKWYFLSKNFSFLHKKLLDITKKINKYIGRKPVICSTKPAKRFSIVDFFGSKIFRVSWKPYYRNPSFKKNFLIFSGICVFPFSIQFLGPLTMFFFNHSIEHAKTQGMTFSDFWKSFFLCPKTVDYKICMQFFGLFWRIFACANFFGS